MGAKSSSIQVQEIILDKAQTVKIIATNSGNKFRVIGRISEIEGELVQTLIPKSTPAQVQESSLEQTQ